MLKKTVFALMAIAFLCPACKEEGTFEKMGKKADKAVEKTEEAVERTGEAIEDAAK